MRNEFWDEMRGADLRKGDVVLQYMNSLLNDWVAAARDSVVDSPMLGGRWVTTTGYSFMPEDRLRVRVRDDSPALFYCHGSAMRVGDEVLRYVRPGDHTYKEPLVITKVEDQTAKANGWIVPRFSTDGKLYQVRRPGWVRRVVSRADVREGDVVLNTSIGIMNTVYWDVETVGPGVNGLRGRSYGTKHVDTFCGGGASEYLVLRRSGSASHWNGACRCGKRTFTLFSSVEHEGGRCLL